MSLEWIQGLTEQATLFVDARDCWRNIYSRNEANINNNRLNETGVQNVCMMVKATKGYV